MAFFNTQTGEEVVPITPPGGQTTFVNAKTGASIPNSQVTQGPDSFGSGGSFTSPGGNTSVVPEFFDFSSIDIPEVNFGESLSLAQQVAGENRDVFFNELLSEEAKKSALELVNTDVTGIKNAVNQLSPFVRKEGDRDTQTNIERAGLIDDFNLSRIGRFNRFNIGQKEQAVDAAGLNTRNRFNTLLNQLETQATGRFSDELLDTLITTTSRDRGADIAGASGRSPRSGAGVAIQDRLDIDRRLGIAQTAQSQIPSAIATGQQLLETPTVFAQPTNVPLNTSNIADKIPVTSNISAGAAQQSIAQTATDIATIPAEQVLSSSLQNEQFNATAGFNAAFQIGSATQSQFTAEAQAIQDALDEDKADEIREQQNQQFQAGLDAREDAQELNAFAQIGSAIIGGILSQPGSKPGTTGGTQGQGAGTQEGGNLVSTIFNGAVDLVSDGADFITDAAGNLFDAGAEFIDNNFGDGDGKLTVGDTEISSSAIGDFFKRAKDTLVQPFTSGDEAQKKGRTIDKLLPTAFAEKAKPAADKKFDAKQVIKAGATAANWDKLSPSEKINGAGQLAVDQLQAKGTISTEDARDTKAGIGAVSTIVDPNASDADKAIAITNAAAQFGTTSFTGNPNSPTTIAGSPVIGQDENNFVVKTGEGVTDVALVPKDEIKQTSNVMGVLNAAAVVSSDASNENKVLALTSLGVDQAQANELISQTQAGNAGAVLSLISTATNWADMNPIQKGVAVVNTAAQTFAAASQLGINAVQGAASTLTAAAGPIGAAVAVVQGVDQAADTFSAIEDMARSKAQKEGTKAAFTQLSGVDKIPGLNKIAADALDSDAGLLTAAIINPFAAAAGFLGGSFGSGKNSGQQLRDRWRDALSSQGFAEKIDGSHHVTLADGSKYNIGADGGSKLQNVGENIDGKTERNTFDVDWSNEVAVESIPDAHLYAIATGLNPTDSKDFGLFTRAATQGLNAATSNASDVEGVRSNFRAMMGDTNPVELGMKLEVMRAQNDITEQEYGVYLDRVNRIFGTQLTPTDRDTSVNKLIGQLQNSNQKGAKELLSTLTSKDKLSSAHKKLINRLKQDAKNGKVPGVDLGQLTGNKPKRNEGRPSTPIQIPAGGDRRGLPSNLNFVADTPEKRQQILDAFPALAELDQFQLPQLNVDLRRFA